jgi:hypothetical protein
MGTWLPQPHQVDFSFFNMLALQTMGGMGWGGMCVLHFSQVAFRHILLGALLVMDV